MHKHAKKTVFSDPYSDIFYAVGILPRLNLYIDCIFNYLTIYIQLEIICVKLEVTLKKQ